MKWKKAETNCSEIPNNYDTISRQAAIDSIQYAGKIGKLTCIDILKRLPPVQPENPNKWIPVKRLPKESGWYICTCYNGAIKRVTFFKWQKRLKQWEKTGSRSYWKIIAWMPLPKPYKEAAEKTEEDDGKSGCNHPVGEDKDPDHE